MIAHAIFYGIALAGNCAMVTGTIFSPLKVDPTSVRLYKTGGSPMRNNDFEYTILKRGSQEAQESPDSKERRSQMGSSFIRFGRGHFEGNLENAGDYASENFDSQQPSGSRITRGRSDVIIRFGRDELKNSRGTHQRQQQQQQQLSDVKFLRFGNKASQPLHPPGNNDFEQLAVVCSNVLASTDGNGNDIRLYLNKIARLCNTLGFGLDNDNDDNRRKSKIIEILEDQSDSVKHE